MYWFWCLQYNALLALVDGVAGCQIDSSLAALDGVLTEPAVARMLSRNLPAGNAQSSDALQMVLSTSHVTYGVAYFHVYEGNCCSEGDMRSLF